VKRRGRENERWREGANERETKMQKKKKRIKKIMTGGMGFKHENDFVRL
jgi:hypothetical protein